MNNIAWILISVVALLLIGGVIVGANVLDYKSSNSTKENTITPDHKPDPKPTPTPKPTEETLTLSEPTPTPTPDLQGILNEENAAKGDTSTSEETLNLDTGSEPEQTVTEAPAATVTEVPKEDVTESPAPTEVKSTGIVFTRITSNSFNRAATPDHPVYYCVVKADSEGRICLGPEYAGKSFTVIFSN